MKFRSLCLNDLFVILKGGSADHRVMIKSNERKAQYSIGVNPKGMMSYD